eukprot:5100122-Heterocapsa_arctica.AAC.1
MRIRRRRFVHRILNSSVRRLFEDGEDDDDEDLKFITVGLHLDDCWTTFGPLLDHFRSTVGPLV